MLIIPPCIRIIEVKDVFVFSKDLKGSENKLEVLINLRTIASHSAIIFFKYISRLNVLLPQPHTVGMTCLVIMAVGLSPLLHHFTIKNTKGTILEILPNLASRKLCTMLLQVGHSLTPLPQDLRGKYVAFSWAQSTFCIMTNVQNLHVKLICSLHLTLINTN